VRGDRDDVFSKGFICPKGAVFDRLDNDPDRCRQPGMRAGVVSLPHGWGHSLAGIRGSVAAARPGVNTNLLTDPLALDPLSGTSVLNGIPVRVKPVRV